MGWLRSTAEDGQLKGNDFASLADGDGRCLANRVLTLSISSSDDGEQLWPRYWLTLPSFFYRLYCLKLSWLFMLNSHMRRASSLKSCYVRFWSLSVYFHLGSVLYTCNAPYDGFATIFHEHWTEDVRKFDHLYFVLFVNVRSFIK